MSQKMKLFSLLFVFGGLGLQALARAEESKVLQLQTHADFFSTETHQVPVLDPQVFVAAPGAAEMVGPQGIHHVAGIRNALVADAASLPIVNAADKSLDLSLGAWLSAKGEAILTPLPDGREKVTVVMSGLKPGGHYSLFENHFEQKPVGFTPLDGNGSDNSFVADRSGKAEISMIAPSRLTHDHAVLLVYHSDGRAHGTSRGAIGVDAHHQLIGRP